MSDKSYVNIPLAEVPGMPWIPDRSYKMQVYSKMPYFINTTTRQGVQLSTAGAQPSYILADDGDYIPYTIKSIGGWEIGLMNIALPYIRDGDTVLDIGANLGTWSVTLAKNPTLTVHSFEPQRKIFLNLCANLWLNQRYNVHAHNCALGLEEDSGKTLAMYSLPNTYNTATASLLPMDHLTGMDVSCKMMHLDDPFFGIDKVNFIKLDVEGYEEQVLRGGAKLIAKWKPIIFFESGHGPTWADIRKSLFDYFTEIGYTVSQIANDDWLAVPKKD